MKIAIIGKGTAGTIVASYLKDKFKNTQIDLYYTDTIKTIGVGEGGGPRLKKFLDHINIDETQFINKTNATKKWGILFEDWGYTRKEAIHHFTPPKEGYSYHFDAEKLQELLISGKQIRLYNSKVKNIYNKSQKGDVEIELESEKRKYDYVVNASGFDKAEHATEPQKEEEKLLLCNEALLMQTDNEQEKTRTYVYDNTEYDSLTLSKAMKHGWLFSIPLKNRTSYGYIYSNAHANAKDVRDEMLMTIAKIEKTPKYMTERVIKFKTFSKGKFCNKRVFEIGNRAAFAEPLEATAIEFVLRECEEIEEYLNSQNEYNGKSEHEKEIIFNKNLDSEMERIALFIGWHYSNGSIYKSKFWTEAKIHFRKMREKTISANINKEFDRWLDNINYVGFRPESSFFGWNFNSFEEVKKAIN